MRTHWLAVAALLATGCGGEPARKPDPYLTPTSTAFRTEYDELEYLDGLANPTPDQWARRKHLDDKLRLNPAPIPPPDMPRPSTTPGA
jgi:hypothetical protein